MLSPLHRRCRGGPHQQYPRLLANVDHGVAHVVGQQFVGFQPGGQPSRARFLDRREHRNHLGPIGADLFDRLIHGLVVDQQADGGLAGMLAEIADLDLDREIPCGSAPFSDRDA